MSIISILFIAVALAMDAFAVSIAAGVHLKSVSGRQRFRLSWHFGLFQALMPVIGWYSGSSINTLIEKYDHWVAFGLLAFVGLHMMKESRDTEKPIKDPTKGKTLVLLSVSTSIDALAVGISMAIIGMGIVFPVIVIGVVAALFTLMGLEIGAKVGSNSRIRPCAQVVGGVILLAIGLNILYQHGALDFW